MVTSTIDDESEEGPRMKITTVGIDLAKNVFGIHGADEKGRVVVRKVLSRAAIREALRKGQQERRE
jgi:hypothetical protein